VKYCNRNNVVWGGATLIDAIQKLAGIVIIENMFIYDLNKKK
jgi:hypothetical protein